MKNFKVTAVEDGKEYWISRAMAVVAIVVGTGGPEPVFLVSQRGPGCPDHVGSWAFTCGYLDWDESLKDATMRECYEELSLVLPEDAELVLWKVVDDPGRDARQNVVFRFVIQVPLEKLEADMRKGIINKASWSRGGESDEVSDIRLVPLSDIDNYDWAFNHYEVISELGNIMPPDWETMKKMTKILFS